LLHAKAAGGIVKMVLRLARYPLRCTIRKRLDLRALFAVCGSWRQLAAIRFRSLQIDVVSDGKVIHPW
jgi:hypothetical protein